MIEVELEQTFESDLELEPGQYLIKLTMQCKVKVKRKIVSYI
jgi:hypothetical protein